MREPPEPGQESVPVVKRTAGLEAPALILLAALSGVWAWWAWKQGAYFGVVLLPGVVVLCLVAILFCWLVPLPAGWRPPRTATIAIVALAALGCWEALSAIWSPAPDVAVADGQRVLGYALAFGLGLWLCALLGPRMNLALLPLAFAAAVAGTATVVALATSDTPGDLLFGGTVDYPLGYRNAEAAYFGIAAFCALGLASDRTLAIWLRALALGTTTLCVDVFLLAQSRGSVLGIAAGLLVYTLASPNRVRALGWLCLALIPAATIVPALTSLYEAAFGAAIRGLDEMHTAGLVAAANTAGAVAIGALAAWWESRRAEPEREPRRGNRIVLWGLAALAAASAIGFVAAVGDPIDWASKRAHEFRHVGVPDFSSRSSRFALNAGSHRYDLWRVAVDDAGDDPLLGDGGGGYQYSYLRHRETDVQQVHDAHSIELETLSEFGIPGLALLVTALVAAVVGVLRARRAGPSAAALAAIALASGAYWLVHTSIDWFWPYPAISAPVLALLGAACAAAPGSAIGSRIRWRAAVGVAAAILAISAVPPFLSERYLNQAYAEWRTDLNGAYDDLDRARQLNRLSDTPMLAEGAIATAAGDRQRAISAFEDAASKRPEEWAAHFLLARAKLRSDPAEARRELQIALELNPLEARVRELARQIHLVGPGA